MFWRYAEKGRRKEEGLGGLGKGSAGLQVTEPRGEALCINRLFVAYYTSDSHGVFMAGDRKGNVLLKPNELRSVLCKGRRGKAAYSFWRIDGLSPLLDRICAVRLLLHSSYVQIPWPGSPSDRQPAAASTIPRSDSSPPSNTQKDQPVINSR